MILALFYLAAVVALGSTIMALTRANAAHALIYLILSLLAVAVLFFLMGAPFAAALEIVIYAGAIMVLFVFVIMMLNLGSSEDRRERQWLSPRAWLLPALLAVILLGELVFAIFGLDASTAGQAVSPKEVSLTLFGPYVLAVEIASMLLLAGLVGAYHLGHDYLRWQRGRGTLMGGLIVPLEHVLLLAALLFSCGLFGLMVRRNLIFILMSLEVMLNAAALAFVAAGARWGQADGQVIFMLILTIAAAEVSVGLGLVLQIHRVMKGLDVDQASRMRG